jgi:hypothetical protein
MYKNLIQNFSKIALAALFMTSLSSCYIRISESAIQRMKESIQVGSDSPTMQTFHPESYRNIDLTTGFMDIEFVQSDSAVRVEVTTSADLIGKIRVETIDGTLVNDFDDLPTRIFGSEHKIVVYGPLPDSLILNGGGDALIQEIEGDSLYLSMNGSGDVRFKRAELSGGLTLNLIGSGDLEAGMLRCGTLTLSRTGSGDTRLAGSTGKAQFSRVGSGDVDASELVAASVEVLHNSGSGELIYNLNGEKIDLEED